MIEMAFEAEGLYCIFQGLLVMIPLYMIVNFDTRNYSILNHS